jgi:ribosomal protein S18 acetylase RimI-like enzyme
MLSLSILAVLTYLVVDSLITNFLKDHMSDFYTDNFEDVFLKAPGSTCLVVVQQSTNKIVGSVVMIPFKFDEQKSAMYTNAVAEEWTSSNTAELIRFAIDPDVEGRGLGKMLLNEFETVAKEKGYKRIWLGTSMFQRRAIGLYTKMGYHFSGKGSFPIFTKFIWGDFPGYVKTLDK